LPAGSDLVRALTLTPSEFAAKWTGITRTERAASQEHFIDLCRMLGFETPNEADPHGEWYAFEKGAEKQDGGDGFADVWKRGHFAWEYKGKRKNLGDAYKQLLQYREALENPPILVVCDLDRFEVHTNFTGTKKTVFSFTLHDLGAAPAEPLRILRAVMGEPTKLRPLETRHEITEAAASRFAELALSLQKRGHKPDAVAHFLNRLLFCLFAEDARLLPKGLVTRLVAMTKNTPERFDSAIKDLFEKMSVGGGMFGADPIEWFNGGLFADAQTLPLAAEDLALLEETAKLDWSNVEPAILGTLFERGLDPAKRSQLGAHYTDINSIMRVIDPVILVPLRRELELAKKEALEIRERGLKSARGQKTDQKERELIAKTQQRSHKPIKKFLARLRAVRVLDPACGSGNFLYVGLRCLKDLEKEVLTWASVNVYMTDAFFASGGLGVGPQNVHGIELNTYAAELARITVWIGEIQWMISNGYNYLRNPILRALDTIECRDAILDRTDPGKPRRASWPAAEFIIGNPPFLGGKKLRTELGNETVEALFSAWESHVPHEADLVSYWHEHARAMIESGKAKRAGLIATNSIRGGANRQVLERMKDTGEIFAAWGDEAWVVDGAAVRVSIVCQDDGSEQTRYLDGNAVEAIHADLTGGSSTKADLTKAERLPENLGVSFMGDTKGGAFDISRELAREFVMAAPNPHGKDNRNVVKPWINGLDVTRRPRDMFIVDFGVEMPQQEAALYEAPFEYLAEHVRPEREKNNRPVYREKWWIHVEPRPALRKAIASLDHYIATPRNGRQRVFAWRPKAVLPDSQIIVVARSDDYTLGVLHSRVHESWSLGMCSWLGIGNDPRYTPTTTFETFPFPWALNTPPAKETAEQRAHRDHIADAAHEMNEKRERWLNPPELVQPEPDIAAAWGGKLPPRMVAVSEAAAKELKKRTLTNLYHTRPQWLDMLHKALDRAVLAAYGWPEGIAEDDLLARLLALNHERAASNRR
jgi:type II restriction/modification system DNA methylase subunit YeeA